MSKLKYVFSHSIVKIAVLSIIIAIITFGISDALLQLNSQKDGIEIILLDTSLSVSSPEILCKEIKRRTHVRYVNYTTVDSSSAGEYVATIENYTMADYLAYLAESRNAELIVVPENFLQDAVSLDNSLPVPENLGGGNYYSLKDKNVTSVGDKFVSITDVYGILLKGDHYEDICKFFLDVECGVI